ncbi:DUF4192 domain-containing protein [Kineosporia sp. J2-2]|uniref:DUF4192 domain-containing protein n=1 Tax=Kineosporia corallincola TaxID=2835133 RepID=A0ABS5TU11_9ACTN|nr:DUF4192 domain-containing protein [Kineosporia corallincola]MBT0774296.1 DUF4192 domain-containing protein [Kineosporia corallincola]
MPRIRLNDPAALVHAVPLILGIQHLSDDLVIVATQARTIVLTARVDLSAITEHAVWTSIHQALIKAPADSIHVVAFPTTVNDQILQRVHADLVQVGNGLPTGVSLGWTITSAHGRWWHHHLHQAAPTGPGTPGRDNPSVAMALTLARGIPAGSRQDIDEATAPLPQHIIAEVRQALTALPAGRSRSQRKTGAQQALDARRERPLRWSIDEAASVLDALRDLYVRDALVIRSDEEHTCWTWCSLLPYAPPAWVAPVATLAAFSAYQQGHSILARSALTRALHTDRRYTLAQLLGRAMELAMSPEDIRVNILAPAHGVTQGEDE